MPHNLEQLRQKINLIDNDILDLLKKRSSCALEILDYKMRIKQGPLEIYFPDREKKIVSRMTENNKSKLSQQAIAKIFGTIIEECRKLQQENS